MTTEPENVVKNLGRTVAFVLTLAFGQLIFFLETFYWKLFWALIALYVFLLLLNFSEKKR